MTDRLTVRFCPANDGPSTIGVEVIGAALTAIEAAIAAICQASDAECTPTLTCAEFADPVMHLSFDGDDVTPIERLVADLAAGGGRCRPKLPAPSASCNTRCRTAFPPSS